MGWGFLTLFDLNARNNVSFDQIAKIDKLNSKSLCEEQMTFTNFSYIIQAILSNGCISRTYRKPAFISSSPVTKLLEALFTWYLFMTVPI
jgi:hypothetical protein